MYIPDHFSMSAEQVNELLEETPYGDLITTGAEGLRATFIPFSIHKEDGRHLLRAHLNRVNTQWKDDSEVMVIFHGPYAYISPTWSPSVADGNNVPPTLDYTILHVYGKMTVHEDLEFLKKHMYALSARTSPEWPQHSLDPAWVKRMLPATVGIEIEITRIEAKAKMSQNAQARDIEGIIAGLEGIDADPKLINFLTEVSLPHAQNREAELERIRKVELDRIQAFNSVGFPAACRRPFDPESEEATGSCDMD